MDFRHSLRNLLALVLLLLLAFLFLSKLGQQPDRDKSFKPMLKLEDTIYLWTDDKDLDPEDLEELGQVEFSYKSLERSLGDRDQDRSSNIFTPGSPIYRLDRDRIVVLDQGSYSILEKSK